MQISGVERERKRVREKRRGWRGSERVAKERGGDRKEKKTSIKKIQPNNRMIKFFKRF